MGFVAVLLSVTLHCGDMYLQNRHETLRRKISRNKGNVRLLLVTYKSQVTYKDTLWKIRVEQDYARKAPRTSLILIRNFKNMTLEDVFNRS